MELNNVNQNTMKTFMSWSIEMNFNDKIYNEIAMKYIIHEIESK